MAVYLWHMRNKLDPVTLRSDRMILEPATPGDAADVLATSDLETFRYHLDRPEPWTDEGAQRFIQRRLEGSILMWIARSADGEPLGSSALLAYDPANRNGEIGATWIAPQHRRSWVNTEMKRLLLGWAFEELNLIRLVLKCDERNETSKKAIQRLGFTYEGTFRSSRILPDGHRRNTAYFSLLDVEWPNVKERL